MTKHTIYDNVRQPGNPIGVLWIIADVEVEQVLPTSVAWQTKARGVETHIMNRGDFCVTGGELFFRGERVERLPDVAFVRRFCKELFDYLENSHVRLVNSVGCIRTCRDKLAAYKALQAHGIPQPRTVHFETEIDYQELVNLLGVDFIAKGRFGREGTDVFVIKEAQDLMRIQKPEQYIFQENIKTSYGRGLRINAVGGEAVNAILNTDEFDFRSNLETSNDVPCELTPEMSALTSEVAKILGGDVLGLDFLFGEGGKLILCEVNSSPLIYGDEQREIRTKIAEFLAVTVRSRSRNPNN